MILGWYLNLLIRFCTGFSISLSIVEDYFQIWNYICKKLIKSFRYVLIIKNDVINCNEWIDCNHVVFENCYISPFKSCKIQLELRNIKILTKEKLFFLLSENVVTTLVPVGIHVEIFKGCRYVANLMSLF